MVKKVIISCFEEPIIPYNFFMADIYTSIKYGLKSKQEWAKIQRNSSQIDIDAEYLNIPLGEGEDAFFNLEQFKNCQTVREAFMPPTEKQLITRTAPKNRAKKKDEVRIMVCDFAFTNTTNTAAVAFESDNTVITCISGQLHNGEYDRVVERIETIGGGESKVTVQRIRELFWDYESDFLVMDLRSGGETLYNELTRPFKHPTRKNWNERGFTVCRDMRLHMIPKTKVDDLIHRTVDPNALQCIIPIVATDTSNDVMWRSLATHMTRGDIRLLIDELAYEETIDAKNYYNMTNEDRALLRLPYVQTELMINEAVNLRQNVLKGGKIQLKEPRKGHKDRIVCLAYGNDFIDKLENLTQYEAERYEDFNESDWEGIFIT